MSLWTIGIATFWQSEHCLTLIRVFWKKNPKVGKTWERHLWKKNPDYYHDDLPIKIENLTFWEIPRASFLEKNPILIFGLKCGKFLNLKRYMSHNDLWINWLLVGISNGVAIPAKSSVTNKRAQFVVLESKKSFGFFFQKWRPRDFPKTEENKNHPKLLQIVYFGFIFHKWRSGVFPI